jgi:hypothetical protein
MFKNLGCLETLNARKRSSLQAASALYLTLPGQLSYSYHTLTMGCALQFQPCFYYWRGFLGSNLSSVQLYNCFFNVSDTAHCCSLLSQTTAGGMSWEAT